MVVVKAPVGELGTSLFQAMPRLPSAFGQPRWNLLQDPEYVKELKWPLSRHVYDKMRNDSQVNGLWLGMTLPIRRYKWMIDPNGSKSKVYRRLSEELNLPIKGEKPKPRKRGRKKFSHDQHLYHALLALVYGFIFFEKVGEIVDEDNGKQWRLRKLAPRMPHSVQEIKSDSDGGLAAIRQRGATEDLDVNRLLAYVWDMEGGNWYGRSILRPIYKNWFIKDKLIRVDLIKHERNGMGVPTTKQLMPDVAPSHIQQAQQIMQAWRTGQGSGATMPYGTDVELKGVSGTLPDTLASIKYHDEAMARSMLMMFMSLGQGGNGGAYNLGVEMVDFFSIAQETIALWYCNNMSEHFIEDWVTWNFGEEEYCPRIVFERVHDTSYSVGDLVALIDKGAVTVDGELEAFLRENGNLPPKSEVDDEVEPPPVVEPPEEAPGTPQETSKGFVRAYPRVQRTAAPTDLLSRMPNRDLRRDMFPHEITSQADFKTIDQTWQTALDALLYNWSNVKEKQIEELAEQISATDDLTALATIEASTAGDELIFATLQTIAQDGLDDAINEAVAQGIEADVPGIDDVVEDMESRSKAVATLLTRSLSEAAGRKAVQLTGGSLSPAEVAGEVMDHLMGLTDSYLKDQFGGAISAAQNAGRAMAMDANNPNYIYGSELLDTATCSPCLGVDGREYGSITEATSDYPTGGFKDCQGGTRCRGTLVAVYGEAGGE